MGHPQRIPGPQAGAGDRAERLFPGHADVCGGVRYWSAWRSGRWLAGGRSGAQSHGAGGDHGRHAGRRRSLYRRYHYPGAAHPGYGAYWCSEQSGDSDRAGIRWAAGGGGFGLSALWRGGPDRTDGYRNSLVAASIPTPAYGAHRVPGQGAAQWSRRLCGPATAGLAAHRRDAVHELCADSADPGLPVSGPLRVIARGGGPRTWPDHDGGGGHLPVWSDCRGAMAAGTGHVAGGPGCSGAGRRRLDSVAGRPATGDEFCGIAGGARPGLWHAGDHVSGQPASQ